MTVNRNNKAVKTRNIPLLLHNINMIFVYWIGLAIMKGEIYACGGGLENGAQ